MNDERAIVWQIRGPRRSGCRKMTIGDRIYEWACVLIEWALFAYCIVILSMVVYGMIAIAFQDMSYNECMTEIHTNRNNAPGCEKWWIDRGPGLPGHS